MNNIIGGIIFIASIFTPVNFIRIQENGWELRKNKNGIKVYTRKIKNSNLVEFKAITTLNTSLQKAIKIIDDVASYPEWMANLQQSKTIKKISDTERYDYYEIIVPWPFENRDMLVSVKSLFPQNNIIHLELINHPEYIPVQQNKVRIEKAKGSWNILSIDERTTKITYQLYSDPGGNIPAWIINLLIVDGPYETLMNLKELVKLKN
jgi:ribosome-associated toxin RatA of RatAB toxin-antitoxin module